MQVAGLSRNKLIGLLVAGLIALATWFLQGPGVSGSSGDVDPESGLQWVALHELPPEASETIALIDAGGPFPYDRDGVVFENREDLLPDHPRGYYREYTVETPGSDDRGARRVVSGSEDEYYWTEDHYASFERIQR